MVALASLAVGIGVSVALATVSAAVFVRHLPYDNPQDLVMVWRQGTTASPLERFWGERRLARQLFTPEWVLRWREQTLPFDDWALVESWETSWEPRVDLIRGRDVERLRGTLATGNLFRLLGVDAALGRTFGDDETDVVVISDRLWRRRFNADPQAIGTSITLASGRNRDRRVVEVVGVLPPRFRFDYPEETEIWLPLTWRAVAGEFPMGVAYGVVARLRPGVPREAAEAAMQVLQDPADRERGARLWLEPVHDYAVGASRPMLLLLSGLALLVLLSGAVNAVTVFAASAVARVGEMRVRRALGASQTRLARQVLVEAATAAVLAGVAGLAVVAASLPALRASLPATLPRVDEIGVGAWSLAGVGLAVAVSTLVAALAPAWLILRDGRLRRLEETRTVTMSSAAHRLRAALLGVQVALVTALLLSGGMLVRSFWHLVHEDKGFEASANVYVADLQVMHPDHAAQPWRERELLTRVRALPYVESAALTSAVPLRGTDFVRRLRRSDGSLVLANARLIDAAYFDVMRIPMLAGRGFMEDERESVAVVSASLAETMFPGENPLGRSLWGVGGRIVGVVEDVRARSLAEAAMPAFYLPRQQEASPLMSVLIRTRMDGAEVAADLRAIVHDVYPAQPIQRFSTLAAVLDDAVADRRASAVVAGGFAAAMLLLAALGLYGHLSHVVGERTRDLAIRAALGAAPRRQVELLVRHIAPPLAGGLAVAMGAVLLAYPWLAPYLHDVGRLDVVVVTVTVSLVLISAVVALAPAARRATRLDVGTVLREA